MASEGAGEKHPLRSIYKVEQPVLMEKLLQILEITEHCGRTPTPDSQHSFQLQGEVTGTPRVGEKPMLGSEHQRTKRFDLI